MILIIGLVILLAAVVIGVAGVLTNTGASHTAGDFSVFGYHVTGSTGTLFLYGIAIGAIAVLGLGMLLVGARRASRLHQDARGGLKESRRQTAAAREERDALAERRDEAQAQAADARVDAANARADAAEARARAAAADTATANPAAADSQGGATASRSQAPKDAPDDVPPDAEFGSHRHGLHRWHRIPARHGPDDPSRGI
ncbi:hypothetical protein [Kitasatospora sp. NPDC057223]|uniref:hypothetical protein n=1 Tax=Kitasatospora sp. NPDC057223 TaxID=3346055 RepID=UPI0036320F7E